MSRIGKIRESVDAKLDKLDARAGALEATLRHAEDHIRRRVWQGMRREKGRLS